MDNDTVIRRAVLDPDADNIRPEWAAICQGGEWFPCSEPAPSSLNPVFDATPHRDHALILGTPRTGRNIPNLAIPHIRVRPQEEP